MLYFDFIVRQIELTSKEKHMVVGHSYFDLIVISFIIGS